MLGDPRTSLCFPLRTAEDKADSHFFTGLANATLQIMLMAESMGLSTQYVSDSASPYFSLMLKHLLGIPPLLRVYHLIPVGYTEVTATPKSRRPLDLWCITSAMTRPSCGRRTIWSRFQPRNRFRRKPMTGAARA